MRTRLLLILTGLAIGFSMPALTTDFSGDFKMLDGLNALGTKLEDAYNQNDATALAALFTEDAVVVTPEGLVYGRQAIERWYAEEFRKWHNSNHTIQGDKINAVGREAWAVGEWWSTLQSSNGPLQARGYYSGVYALEGDTWKIRMSMYNVSGRTSLTPSPASSPGTN